MKNYAKKIAIVLVIALVATGSYFISETYAKYTSSATGTDTARVALWSFKVNNAQIATSNTFTFNLFSTINEEDTTTGETDVSSANSEKVIAPGTGGSFNITLENLSEVSAKYGIDYTVTNTAGIPIEFKVDNGEWTSSLTDVIASDTNTKLAAKTGTKTITIQWRWPYEVQDAESDPATYDTRDGSDTTLGTAGTATLEVSAKVTATQID